MKELSFEQMEKIEGGEYDLCDIAIPIASASAYSSVYWAAGPIGWGMAALSVASLIITAYQCYPNT